MKMSQIILCSTTLVPFNANLNLLKKHLVQYLQFIFFYPRVCPQWNKLVGCFSNPYCDLICLPTKFFAYTSHFLIQLLITHYSNTVRFFMKTFLTVYIGFQSYFILYILYKFSTNNKFFDNNA